MKHALYIIGEPGVGKTTLTTALTSAVPVVMSCTVPFLHRHYANGVTELGGQRDAFGGTDALGMAVQPKAIDFIQTDPTAGELLLAEGDRLANDAFWRALQDAGYHLHIFALVGSRAAARRREARGSQQDPNWVKGRVTKVLNLMERWGPAVTVADATLPIPTLLRCMTDPVSLAFREAP